MKIIADENIPCVKDVFGGMGEVVAMPGREITASTVSDADVLLVRSVTPVNEKLLSDSEVRFVGTATIGTDHVDEQYLERRGIHFTSAPGSNAESVAEYITAAVLTIAFRRETPLRGKSLGVIGAGNVGSLVVKKGEALGMEVTKNDPPLARQTGDPTYRPLEEALRCDYVTLHVPLEDAGPDPTFEMVDENFLKHMKPEAVLLNSSRGPVCKESALKGALINRKISAAVLDVWKNEPEIDIGLMGLANIATPHIAGYSLDGKYAGVEMLYRALCAFYGCEPRLDIDSLKPAPEINLLRAEDAGDLHASLQHTVRKIYDIEQDDRKLRKMRARPASERAQYFTGLRKNYPVRREFHTAGVEPEEGMDKDKWRELSRILNRLGFAIEAP